MARIVFATLGSLGDLHPIIAFALGLRDRGHVVAITTDEIYREKIGALGLTFHALGPNLLENGEQVIGEIMDGPRGTVRLMRDHLFPAVKQMHTDLAPLVDGADVLIASELIFAAPILMEKRRVRWISYTLAPVSLYSIYDPPLLPVSGISRTLQRGGPRFHRLVKRIAKLVSYSWWRPVRKLRRELGLTAGNHPLFEGKYSPELNLVLFSSVLQPPQRDWPPHAVQTGFLFHDEAESYPALPVAVTEFLAAGEPPIVFTLGSAAVHLPGKFYAESVRAAERLGRRALLLLGQNPPPPDLPPSVLAWDYLPYAQIFPHAAALVHQGGVGTTAQALRAGRPMLIVPFAHDQFDNAARITRLGAGKCVGRSRYHAPCVARALDDLLTDPRFTSTVLTLSEKIQAERAVATACHAVEAVLR